MSQQVVGNDYRRKNNTQFVLYAHNTQFVYSTVIKSNFRRNITRNGFSLSEQGTTSSGWVVHSLISISSFQYTWSARFKNTDEEEFSCKILLKIIYAHDQTKKRQRVFSSSGKFTREHDKQHKNDMHSYTIGGIS